MNPYTLHIIAKVIASENQTVVQYPWYSYTSERKSDATVLKAYREKSHNEQYISWLLVVTILEHKAVAP